MQKFGVMEIKVEIFSYWFGDHWVHFRLKSMIVMYDKTRTRTGYINGFNLYFLPIKNLTP